MTFLQLAILDKVSTMLRVMLNMKLLTENLKYKKNKVPTRSQRIVFTVWTVKPGGSESVSWTEAGDIHIRWLKVFTVFMHV